MAFRIECDGRRSQSTCSSLTEAGQLSLADALAASRAAHNLILLGDPLQLPQVAQASHLSRQRAQRPRTHRGGGRHAPRGPGRVPVKDMAHASRRLQLHL